MFKLKGGQFVFDEDTMIKHDPVTSFKSLWSGEHAAIDIYRACMERLSDEHLSSASLCHQLHVQNSKILAKRIQALKDTPEVDLGHRLLELAGTLAAAAPEVAICAILAKIESELLSEYMDSLSTFENENLDLLQNAILPNQHKCFDAWAAERPAA
jgi:hypothetical protein